MFTPIDIDALQALLVRSVFLLPIFVGLVQVVKTSTLVPARFLPLVAVVLGAGFGWVVLGASVTAAIVGIALGLASVGLYEFGKTTVAGIK